LGLLAASCAHAGRNSFSRSRSVSGLMFIDDDSPQHEDSIICYLVRM
jgi:hypothetical protein